MKKIKKLFSALTHIGDGTGNFIGDGTGGFTMIELLVVIAVIGVLAVAVLSSIDPIEQINKGRDTRVRSNAAQLINAVDRYYAIAEIYPWNDAQYDDAISDDTDASDAFPDGIVCTANADGFCQIGGVNYARGDQLWLSALSETKEVKTSFINQLEDDSSSNALYLAKADATVDTDDSLYICFTPSSKQFQNEAVEGCVDRGDILPDGACVDGVTYDDTTPWTAEMICLP